MYAVIKIANASQLRTAFAFNYSSPGDGKRVADMAKKMNGVFAINGDYYSHSWHTNGYMVRQGNGVVSVTFARQGRLSRLYAPATVILPFETSQGTEIVLDFSPDELPVCVVK